jgi:hypothetical protein
MSVTNRVWGALTSMIKLEDKVTRWVDDSRLGNFRLLLCSVPDSVDAQR